MSPVNVKRPDAVEAAGLVRLDEALRLLEQEERRVAPLPAAPIAALFDLVQRVLGAASIPVACRIVADGLKSLVDCTTAAVVLVHRKRRRCEGVSQVDVFDRHAEQIVRYETAAGRIADAHHADPSAAPAVVRIDGLICLPIRQDDRLAAVCILDGERGPASPAFDAALEMIGEALSRPLAVRLALLERTSASAWRNRITGVYRRNRRLAWVAAIAVAAAAWLPVPYRVRCDCELQPVVRRHVVAPFDGVLERSLCKPGDVVVAGQSLARLDSKELTWELASVTADRDRAEKSRDVNLSSGKTAAAQIDRFEARRLDERRKLLEHRLSHLDVKSPIAGVVVSGDLDRAEGAPVKLGRSLFEVAPLDQMIVEVLVPETEIDHLRIGQDVSVSCDSAPGATLTGTVSRVFPRAEIRDEANVFVAEVVLPNDDGALRPGMKGRAAVRTEPQPLAWIAAHRVVDAVQRWLW